MQLPIAKPVGAPHAPPAVNSNGTAAAQVAVPPPSTLLINGNATGLIDVRSMSPPDIVNAINNAGLPGVSASMDGSGRLIITGVQSISGDGNLRAILGI